VAVSSCASGKTEIQFLAFQLFAFQKRAKDHLGIEGDEGSTMLEDVVSPMSHGQLGGRMAEEDSIALPGIIRNANGASKGFHALGL